MAIPPNAANAMQRGTLTGIIVSVTPSTVRNIYVVLQRTAGTSSGTFQTVTQLHSIGDSMGYTDVLPKDNVRRYYRAFHRAPGYGDGAVSGIVSAKPTELVLRNPVYTPPSQNPPVASTGGPSKYLTFSGNAFDPSEPSYAFGRTHQGIFSESGLTKSAHYTYPISLGTQVKAFRAYLHRPSTGDLAVVKLLKVNTTSTAMTATTLVTFTATAGVAKLRTSSTFTPFTMTTGLLLMGLIDDMRNRSTGGGPFPFPALYYTQVGIAIPNSAAGLR